MSRAATRWAYGSEITESCLSFSERAVLRALCWCADPETGNTDKLFDHDLMRLTGYKGSQPIRNARKHLKKLGLLTHDPDYDPDEPNLPYGFRYHLRFDNPYAES